LPCLKKIVSKKIIFFDTALTEFLTVLVRVLIIVIWLQGAGFDFWYMGCQALFKTAAHILALTIEPV